MACVNFGCIEIKTGKTKDIPVDGRQRKCKGKRYYLTVWRIKNDTDDDRSVEGYVFGRESPKLVGNRDTLRGRKYILNSDCGYDRTSTTNNFNSYLLCSDKRCGTSSTRRRR